MSTEYYMREKTCTGMNPVSQTGNGLLNRESSAFGP